MPDVKGNETRDRDAEHRGGSFIDQMASFIKPDPGSLIVPNMSLRYLGKLQSFPSGGMGREDATT
ncbi:MAG: hypothetical protein AAFY59_13310 [Pseudomonadota bacterium]